MIFCKIVVTTAMVMAFASAWSTQFPQLFHSLLPQSPAPPPSPFGPFYRNTQQQLPHYQPQFRQPLLQWYQPPPTASTLLSLRVLPSQDVLSTADHHQHHYHHHHHVIYYYYSEADGTPVTGRNAKFVPRQSLCDTHPHPVVVPGFPPEYLPPLPPQIPQIPPTAMPPPPPLPPQIPQIPPTAMPPTTTQRPCDEDDTVVVDNIDYYPFGKRPIIVGSETAMGNHTRLRSISTPKTVSNFILSNYLLPPDK